MYIAITLQNAYGKEVKIWEGDWTEGNYKGPPSEALRSFHQFMEGYEPHDWIWINKTAEEFDKEYAAGHRIFWLTSRYTNYIVHMEDPPAERAKLPTQVITKQELEEFKAAKEVLEELTCTAINYLIGEEPEEDLRAVVQIAREFDDYKQPESARSSIRKLHEKQAKRSSSEVKS